MEGENLCDLRKHGSPFPFNVDCMTMPPRVRDCLKALNQLAGNKFVDLMQLPCPPPTSVQSEMVSHVATCVSGSGCCPAGLDGNQH